MKKELKAEDAAMIFQWVVVALLTPFLLLPLFPRGDASLAVRGLMVGILYSVSGVMSVAFVLARRKSRQKAIYIANGLFLADIVMVFLTLLLWPDYLPSLFWIFTVLIVVVAVRFGYRETLVATLALSVLYAVTIVTRIGGELPARTVVGDTLVRIVLMIVVGLATAYIAQRQRSQRRDAKVLSDVAAAIGTKLDADELMKSVVEGISEASGLGRCSALLVSRDGRWAVPQSTTERDSELRSKFFKKKIDLHMDNVASRVLESREPMVITDAENNGLVDKEWISEFGVSALLVLPMLMRGEARGIVFVERHGIKKHFSDKEVRICRDILAQGAAGYENAMRYAEEQKRRSESDTLYRTSRELGSSLSMEHVLQSACQLAIQTADSVSCTAFITDESTRIMEPRVSVGPGGAVRDEFSEDSSVPAAEMENMYNLAQRPPALVLNHPEQSAAIPPFLRLEGVLVLVPFYSHGTLTGILCISDEEGKDFSEEDLTRLAIVAGEAAMAVVNARLHERIKTDAAQMASLVQLANAIGTTADLETIMRLAMETVRHLFDCDSGHITRLDEHEGTLKIIGAFGYPDETEAVKRSFRVGLEECWSISEGRLVYVNDLARAAHGCRVLLEKNSGSAICMGMRVEGRILGTLHIYSEKPNAFKEEDQQLALAISDQVALAIQRALLFEEINRLAITDPLTGVFNVRHLDTVLSDESNRALRYGRPVSLLMVDLDNLKSYNDSLGHQKGDIALSQVASILDSNTREVDKVFRYGGDEFCVVLPETGAGEATVVAEKVRKAVSDFHFPGEEKIEGRSLTVSIGVASMSGAAAGETDLVRKADFALYSAKQKGRNRVASEA